MLTGITTILEAKWRRLHSVTTRAAWGLVLALSKLSAQILMARSLVIVRPVGSGMEHRVPT